MRRHPTIALFSTILGLVLALFTPLPGRTAIPVASAAPLPVGYADFKYPLAGNTPSGEKPQSKLWYNDGRWWADMLYTDGQHYIFYLDLASQSWVKTTTLLDPRTQTKSDCLWDGTHLYVASGGGNVSTGTNLDGVLYRYSYNPSTQTYSKDLGPITIRTGGAETLVLDQDSTGRLWITYTQSNKVWINRSTTADDAWNPSAAFNPPSAPSETASATVDPDDISSLVAFDGKIGVLWSKHNTLSGQTDPNASFYFAYRADSAADNIAAWQTKNIYKGPDYSDDHINIKSLQAAGKEVYAVVKTSTKGTSSTDALILLLGRRADGAWIQPAMISSTADGLTRPVLLIDPEQRKLHVFMSTEGGGNVYYKQSSMDTIAFPAGKGTMFIQSGSGLTQINNATSTKQTVSGATGIVVLASDDSVKWYAHNYLPLGSAGPRVVFDPSVWIANGQAGVPLDPQPVVWVQSQPGQIDTSYNGPVSVGIKSGTGAAGASVWGTVTVGAVKGVARFSGLSISKAGTGYRLTASAPSRASSDSNPFDIAMGGQTISFAPLANKNYGDQPFTLNASASSELPVSFSAGGACTLAGATLTISGVGICDVTASQAGDTSYEPAPDVTRSFSIGKRDQTIEFSQLADKHYGDPPFVLSASASSGLPVSFSAAGVCTIANGAVSLTGVGNCTITASQAGNTYFNPASPVARTFRDRLFFNIYVPLIKVS